MKKVSICLLIVLCFIAPMRSISQTQIQQTLHLIADSLSFNAVAIDTMLFTKVHYAYESGRICDTGCPELPIVSYNFIIPQNKVATQITLSNKVFFSYTINHPIYPVQKPEVTCIDCATPDFCHPNRQVYESTVAFPANNMVTVQHNFFDGNHILTIGICPFEYYPATGQINMLTSFDLNIGLVPDTVQRNIIHAKRLCQSQEIYNRMLEGLVENKNQINTFQNTPIIVDEIGDTPSGLPAYEYVVVTPSAYTSAFSDFVTWKKQKGIDIGIVTIEEVLSHYSGDEIHDSANNLISVINDNAGKLRQYLREAYSQGMVYALLAGDLPSFPIRYGWAINNVPDTDYDNVIPTDLYFADFDGNWNVDGDAYYGEFGYGMQADDAPDFFADIFVGRLICSSIQDISNWVAKMLIYEKNPGLGNPSYLLRSFMTEADQAQKDSLAEQVAVHLSMYNHSFAKESPNYNSPNPISPCGSDIVRNLNTRPCGLVSWFNHGGTGNGESGIATMTSRNNHYPQWKLQAQEGHPHSQAVPDTGNGLDNLTNNNEPFVVYAISCNVTPFDRTSSFNNSGARNCGESITVNSLSGGIAFLGNCRNGIFNESFDLYKEFADVASEYSEGQDYPQFGVLENTSKSNCPFGYSNKYLCYSHNLIGDPECSLWTTYPESLSVSVLPQTAVLNNPNCFHVIIDNLDFGKKAIVTLYKEGELVQRIEVIGNQQYTAEACFNSVVPNTFDDIIITVTSFGCLPYQESIAVDEKCEIVINDTQVWNIDNTISCDIIINPNSSLIITSELCMAPSTKIIVKPGGYLYLNGGKLTSSCSNEMWQGIEVWGNSNVHQFAEHGSYGQGYLEMRNGAVIENAKCAVELWHPEIYNATGGIIKAVNATFRNNAKAVHALYYSNVFLGREYDYAGSFHNCTFMVDEDYIGTYTFYKHIDMSHVKGLVFSGCSFSAKRSVSGVSPYCLGIAAYEAGFSVNSYCSNNNMIPCPPANYYRPSFNGFYSGIYASNDGSKVCSFVIKDAEFINNTYGIHALNMDYGLVEGNDFIVGSGWNCDFGIYSNGVSNFCFEDNTFQPKAVNEGSSYGIVIVNSDGINDVYNNDFQNLRCGNVAIGDNTVIGNQPSIPIQGLTYSCNTNLGNQIDFCVLKDGDTGGIAFLQGSETLPAGNTFGGSLYHIYNDGATNILYNYDGNESNQTPTPSLLYRVFTNGIHYSNSCLSHYGGRSVSKSASEKTALASEYNSGHSTYNNLLQLYESCIDGGNTPTQVADINNATSSNMWQLRAQLLDLSPYVSGEVLTTAADRYDVFTDPILFEILAANPDELKNDTLISYLENKEHPLPAYMTNLLRQIASGFTARTAMLAQMAQYRHAYSLAAGDIVRSCLNDSVTNPTELRTWLGNMDDIASDRMIVASYLQEGDSTNAFALANLLPELYGLQGEALADHADYMRLIGLYQTLNREHRTIFELTDNELAMVNGIAESGTGTSKMMAKALKMERTEEQEMLSNCPTMPESNGGNRGNVDFMDTSMNEVLGFVASVSPNPATTWTTVEYTLPADKTQAFFTVTNTLGVTMISEELNGRQGQKVLDLRGLANGIYVYTVRCGEYVQTGKLIITK